MKINFTPQLRIILLIFLSIICVSTNTNAALVPGDIAVVGFNAETADGQYASFKFSFVLMKDITPADGSISFTDKGWIGGAFSTNGAADGVLKWTPTTTFVAGTIITVTVNSGASIGTFSSSNANFTTQSSVSSGWTNATVSSGGGDQVLVYQGTEFAPTFIYGFTNTASTTVHPTAGTWATAGVANAASNSELPPGLTNGLNAVANTKDPGVGSANTARNATAGWHADNLYFSGPYTGTRNDLLVAIGNPANWIGDDANVSLINLTPGSSTMPIKFTVTVPCTLPATPTSTGATICSGKSAQISAKGETGGTLSWYTTPTGGTKIAVGTNFTTPLLSNTITYYVQDSTCGISASRAVTVVNVTAIPQAPIVTPIQYCQNTSSSALTATGSNLKWYGTASTGGTANSVAPTPSTAIANTLTYYVSQTVSSCESPRAGLSVTVIAAPTSSAGASQTNVTSSVVNLIGTGSSTGVWTLVDGPTSAGLVYTPSASSANVTVSGLTISGVYNFRYTVSGTAPCADAKSEVAINVSIVTDVEESTFEQAVNVYPNPFTSNFDVILNGLTEGTIIVTDLLGKEIYRSTNSTSQTIPMQDYVSGMYIVHVKSGNNVLTRSVVKK